MSATGRGFRDAFRNKGRALAVVVIVGIEVSLPSLDFIATNPIHALAIVLATLAVAFAPIRDQAGYALRRADRLRWTVPGVPKAVGVGPRPGRCPYAEATSRRSEGSKMVHIKDEGVFDESIDKIWKYLQDEQSDLHVHRSIPETKTVEQKGATVLQEIKFLNPDGKTTRTETWRTTFNPPKGFEMESVAGISKGTRYTHRYTAEGNRTRVDVEGEFRMQGMDDASTKKAALGFLAEVFDEDSKNLRRYK